jgi:hypothetical protein
MCHEVPARLRFVIRGHGRKPDRSFYAKYRLPADSPPAIELARATLPPPAADCYTGTRRPGRALGPARRSSADYLIMSARAGVADVQRV